VKLWAILTLKSLLVKYYLVRLRKIIKILCARRYYIDEIYSIYYLSGNSTNIDFSSLHEFLTLIEQ
jgi:hypothetical protein